MLALSLLTYIAALFTTGANADVIVALSPMNSPGMCVGWVAWSPNMNLLLMPCIPAFQTLYRFTWSDTGVIQFTNGPIFVIDAPPAAGSPAALRQLNFGVEQIFTRGVNGIIQMASNPGLCLDAGAGAMSTVVTVQPCDIWKTSQRFGTVFKRDDGTLESRDIEEREADHVEKGPRREAPQAVKEGDVQASLDFLANIAIEEAKKKKKE